MKSAIMSSETREKFIPYSSIASETREKFIPYSSIAAVQMKKPGFAPGFLQFTIKGGIEGGLGTFEALNDENTINFVNDSLDLFEKAKVIIEQKIKMSSNIHTQPVNNKSIDFEQLEKLASLKDKGIINEDEFNTKKKQILGL